MKPAIFFMALAFVMRQIIKEPIWATMAAVYVYFCIPMREYHAPAAPYLAGFFALAVILLPRNRTRIAERAQEEIEEKAVAAADQAAHEVAEKTYELVADEVVSRRSPEEIKRRVVEQITPLAHEVILKNAPGRVTGAVKAGFDPVLAEAVEASMNIGLDVLENFDRSGAPASGGNLRNAVIARVPGPYGTVMDARLGDEVEAMVRRLIDQYNQEHRTQAYGDTGVLGVPLPRTALTGMLTNYAVWFHLIFVIMNYVCAQNALHSVAMAMKQFEVSYLLFIPVIALSTSIRALYQMKWVIWAWMAGIQVIANNGIQLWLKYGGRADDNGGQGGDANFLCALCVSMAPIALSMFLVEKKPIPKWLGLVAAGYYAVGVIAGGSRGALLAMIASMGYWILFTNRKGAAVGLALVGAAGFMLTAPAEFWERMGTMFLPKDMNPWILQSYEPSAEERKTLWEVAKLDIKLYPWLGIGPLNFVPESALRTGIVPHGGGPPGIMTHNTWLQQLAEYGIPAGGLWCAGYAFALISIIRARLKAKKLRDDPEYGWVYGYLLGFECGLMANAVAVTFVSFQWLDYMYYIFVCGPVFHQVVKDGLRQREWFLEREIALKPRPPARYGPPREAEGFGLDRIDLSRTPALRPAARAPG
jgi:O-antigen ligase